MTCPMATPRFNWTSAVSLKKFPRKIAVVINQSERWTNQKLIKNE